MSGASKREIEGLLRAHYRGARGVPDAEGKAACMRAVRAAVASDGRTRVPAPSEQERATIREATFPGFVATQALFVRPWIWAAQIALVALMVAACLQADGMSYGFSCASAALAAATVLVGLPDLLGSAAHGMAELECACRFDCRAVAVARLVVLGCSDVAVVSVIAVAPPLALGADPFAALVHACAPYFLSCAGALFAASRLGRGALPAACAWTLVVAAGAYAAFSLAPSAYAQASAWAWAFVAAASLAWAAREACAWLRRMAEGLDVFLPSPAPRW